MVGKKEIPTCNQDGRIGVVPPYGSLNLVVPVALYCQALFGSRTKASFSKADRMEQLGLAKFPYMRFGQCPVGCPSTFIEDIPYLMNLRIVIVRTLLKYGKPLFSPVK